MIDSPSKQRNSVTSKKKFQPLGKQNLKDQRCFQIAFGIAVDRLKSRVRTPSKDVLRVTHSRRLSICRDVSSRCVRKFTYISNEEAVTSSSIASLDRDSDTASSDSKPNTLIGRSDISSCLVQQSSSQLHRDSSTHCYYMRSDNERSHDTVLVAKQSLPAQPTVSDNNSNDNNDQEEQQQQQQQQNYLCSAETATRSSSNGRSRGSTFRLKLDRQQLARALGPAATEADASSATVDFPSELLVDVNCSSSCRVSAVSLRQNDSQQCVLSLTVVEASSTGGSRSRREADSERLSETARSRGTAQTGKTAKMTAGDLVNDDASTLSGGFGDAATRH
ncbi:hypothetical protein BOX15_Mlig006220g3 [Macrostomum lignano]|uniref:Uncharacterized protein n=1 Tax=Macrostomum lignano TaxID=282301 RepID=A0A267H388_9PLAT|nr:hypothetical protein BOX15_Mlig006220g3 [Macrostomum lignano]